jgi:hypothetical protein
MRPFGHCPQYRLHRLSRVEPVSFDGQVERSLSARECVTRWPTDLGSVASEADIQAPLLRCVIVSASRARGAGPRSRKSTRSGGTSIRFQRRSASYRPQASTHGGPAAARGDARLRCRAPNEVAMGRPWSHRRSVSLVSPRPAELKRALTPSTSGKSRVASPQGGRHLSGRDFV